MIFINLIQIKLVPLFEYTLQPIAHDITINHNFKVNFYKIKQIINKEVRNTLLRYVYLYVYITYFGQISNLIFMMQYSAQKENNIDTMLDFSKEIETQDSAELVNLIPIYYNKSNINLFFKMKIDYVIQALNFFRYYNKILEHKKNTLFFFFN